MSDISKPCLRKETNPMMLQTYVHAQNLIARLRDEVRGATAVEYGMIVALIAAIIVGLVAAIGSSVEGGFSTVNAELTANGGN